MNQALGLIIESLVAILLVVTIGYCALLNTRLKRLKADEQSLKATIGELITATEIAERAIAGLKLTVRDCDENLGTRLTMAGEMVDRLHKQLGQGDDVMRRLSRIVTAARPAEAPTIAAPNARTVAAAAQAFSERKRVNGLAA